MYLFDVDFPVNYSEIEEKPSFLAMNNLKRYSPYCKLESVTISIQILAMVLNALFGFA